MILEDILSLIGRSSSPETDHTPIACLLSSGYGCVGYFNSFVNESLSYTIVLLNMRLADLRVEEGHSRRGSVADIDDFLQDVVAQHVQADEDGEESEPIEMPLVDLRMEEGHSRRGSVSDVDDFLQDVVAQHVEADEDGEIAMLYPVAHIAALLKSATRVTPNVSSETCSEVPAFPDFRNKSIVLRVLRTQIW